MIRINLLPPEIVQKRKDEKRWGWVALGAVVAVAIVMLGFAVLQLQVSTKQAEVASIRQQAAALKEKADKFRIFQQKKTDLATRKQIASSALSGRMDWSKMLAELCLVLPSDIYLQRIGVTEPKMSPPTPGSLSVDGRALDYPNDVPDLGYKSVAKLLIRLAELNTLDNVWLSSSTKPAAPVAQTTTTDTGEDSGSTATPADYYITFSITSQVTVPSTATANTSGVPAPPTP
jgi:Tfp pilus assembly protein PilN